MRKIFILILFLLLCPKSVYSQDVLTWQECVQKAKELNPELVSAAENVKQAAADKDISLSAMAPQIDADLVGRRGKSSVSKATDTYSYGITGRQLLFDGFKTSSEVTGAMRTIYAQQYNYDVISSDIRLNLRTAFTSLMRAQELVYITEDIAKRRKQNLELVKLRYDGGRENRGSLLTAEADVAQAEFEVMQARRAIVLTRRELSKELGIGLMEPFEAKGDFSLNEDYSVKPDIDILADTTPFLKELIMKKEAARYNLDSAEADFFPKVYLNGSSGKTGDKWLPRSNEWSAGLSVSLPILEGGSRIAGVSKAISQLYQAEAERRSGQDTVLVTLERAWKDLQDSIAEVSVRKKFLVAAEERAKITRAQYATGLASFNDWIIIEDNLVSAQKNFLNTKSDMLISEAYWIQAIGGTLEYDQEQV